MLRSETVVSTDVKPLLPLLLLRSGPYEGSEIETTRTSNKDSISAPSSGPRLSEALSLSDDAA
jgi:hypothetical protein